MKSRFHFIGICSLFFVLWCGTVAAHEDTLITLKGNQLAGLPAKYAPAELDLKAFRIRVKDHAMTFSPLLRSFFEQPHDLRISASWYHNSATLPPYLLLRVTPKKRDFSYHILLNLETLDLIHLTIELRESDAFTRTLGIDVSEKERQEIRKSVEKIK